ncbi:peptidoglycan D,D-transpeptidase FtsI family protein [Actinomyces minihominis]|uniref:peptidoglycan D,D-transpeptidase FtsI family protein n=1 Tax=Actinomyces minihominis TaxID=2002838 RepID=UPI000C08BE2B|nr:penicillin-binding protein 2 [Actinomyces minihominis]
MNPQIRRIFLVVLGLFALLGISVTWVQFVQAPDLVADSRNARRYLEAASKDRGPIIVGGSPVALSEQVENSSNYQRVYPDGKLYTPITGYFSAVNLSATGLEAAENSVLEGAGNVLFWQRIRALIAGQPRQGGGVVTTIDPNIQAAAAELLGDNPGAVVVLDAKTSAVRALYSSPTYDPNPLASLDTSVAAEAAKELEADPARPLDNRAIAGNRYAPGSTFKIITAAAMLEAGISPNTEVEAPVSTVLPNTDTTVSNIDQSECGNGHPTFTEAFARSCNTAFIIESQKLAPDALAKMAERFGFGQTLNIPLTVTPSTFPTDMDAAQTAMSSIGQFEVQTTPMQMAMVAQAIANGGEMMYPYLVESIVDADNKVRSTTSARTFANPISKEIASEIGQMMVATVNEPYGTAQSAALPGIQVAAKTGTAEVGDGTRANAWTVAYAPADDPQLVVAVIVEGTEERPIAHGGAVAAPMSRVLLEVGLR